jgi:hypothetical protein
LLIKICHIHTANAEIRRLRFPTGLERSRLTIAIGLWTNLQASPGEQYCTVVTPPWS